MILEVVFVSVLEDWTSLQKWYRDCRSFIVHCLHNFYSHFVKRLVTFWIYGWLNCYILVMTFGWPQFWYIFVKWYAKKETKKTLKIKEKKKKEKKNNDETKPNKTQHMSHTRCILRQRSPISTEKISPGNQLSLTRKYCFIYLTFSLLLLTEKKLSKIVEDTFTCSKHHSLRK